MVYTQPGTGRKVLNVSPTSAIVIYGMENAKGDALLEEIVSHSLNPAFAYYHDWEEQRPRALGQLADPALCRRRAR